MVRKSLIVSSKDNEPTTWSFLGEKSTTNERRESFPLQGGTTALANCKVANDDEGRNDMTAKIDIETKVMNSRTLTPQQYMTDLVLRRIEEAGWQSSTLPCLSDTEVFDTAQAIDISPWLDPEAKATDLDQVARQVLQAAQTTGSFRIKGHEIPHDVLDNLDKETRNFFQKPIAKKLQYKNYLGMEQEDVNLVVQRKIHSDNTTVRDLRESCFYDVPTPYSFSSQSGLAQAVSDYSEHLERLDCIVHQILTRALSLLKKVDLPNNYLEYAKGGSAGRLRCNWYPPVPEDRLQAAEREKLRAHSDLGTCTILYIPKVAGLEEIRNGVWTPVPPTDPSELHVALGHLAHLFSNGAFQPNIHRVTGDNASFRTSYAYFCIGNSNVDAIGPVLDADGVEKPLFEGKIVARQYVQSILDPFLTQTRKLENDASARGELRED